MGASFGKYLRSKRLKLLADDSSFSIRSLSRRIGVHHSYLSKIERGESATLSEWKLVALARELGENPDLFLGMNGKLSENVRKFVLQKPMLFGILVEQLKTLDELQAEIKHPSAEIIRLQTIFDHCPLHFFILDGHGTVTLANRSCIRHFLDQETQFKIQPLTTFFPLTLAQQLANISGQVLEGKTPLSAHLSYQNNGESHVYWATLAPLANGSDGACEVCVFGAEMRVVERSNTGTAEGEAILRHNLRAPRGSLISGTNVLLQQEVLTPFQKELLEEMRKVQERLLSFMDVSLDLEFMDKSHWDSRQTTLDIVPILHEALRQCSEIIQAKRLRIILEIQGRPLLDGDSFHVSGEERLCLLLLLNLVKNAAEAAPRESTVRIARESGPAVRIHNRGAVPEKIRDRFFEKFTTFGKQGGAGLGTYIAWRIAQALSGYIHMATSEEHGTTVTVGFRPI